MRRTCAELLLDPNRHNSSIERLTDEVIVSAYEIPRRENAINETRLDRYEAHSIKIEHHPIGGDYAFDNERPFCHRGDFMTLKRLRLKIHPIFLNREPDCQSPS